MGKVNSDRPAVPVMTREQVLAFYDGLVHLAKCGEEQVALRRLDELAEADIRVLVRELGVVLGRRRQSRAALREAVLGRLKQSILLGKHTTRANQAEQGGEVRSVDRTA
jgi:hypothetical protein